MSMNENIYVRLSNNLFDCVLLWVKLWIVREGKLYFRLFEI